MGHDAYNWVQTKIELGHAYGWVQDKQAAAATSTNYLNNQEAFE